MFKPKWWIPLVVILFSSLAILGLRLFAASNNHVECPIKPFDDFAYSPDDVSPPISKVLPSSPWQLETTIPGQEGGTYNFSDIQIKLARTNSGEPEIWLFKNPDYDFGTLTKAGSFFIYRPNSQTWEEISAQIVDSDMIARDLFLTSDGTVWAGISNFQEPPYVSKVPVLSKYNELTNQFEAAVGGMEMSAPRAQTRLIEIPHIVLDKQDVFWIFLPGEGIYYYDPKTETTERLIDLPHMGWLDTALSVDGSIYFQDVDAYGTKNFLFQFIPTTEDIVPVEIPRSEWIYSNGLLVDHEGRLWLGATGYLDTDGRWHLIHPHLQENFKHFGDPFWAPPTLIFESSNGMLWYAEDHDMGQLGEGTAWYDPEAEHGCLFTNIASFIVEDSEKNLWMVADSKLYSYPLEP